MQFASHNAAPTLLPWLAFALSSALVTSHSNACADELMKTGYLEEAVVARESSSSSRHSDRLAPRGGRACSTKARRCIRESVIIPSHVLNPDSDCCETLREK